MRRLGMCGGCRGSVLWVRLPSGSRMPVDPSVDSEGTIAVMRDVAGTWIGRALKAAEQPDAWERRHVTHFATCPAIHAERERKAQADLIAAAPNVTSLAEFADRRRAR